MYCAWITGAGEQTTWQRQWEDSYQTPGTASPNASTRASTLLSSCLFVHCIALRWLDVQFACMRNIQRFLQSCQHSFGLRQADLFDAHVLYECSDFGRVRTHRLTHTHTHTHTQPTRLRLVRARFGALFIFESNPTSYFTMYEYKARAFETRDAGSWIPPGDSPDSSATTTATVLHFAVAFLCRLVLYLSKYSNNYRISNWIFRASLCLLRNFVLPLQCLNQKFCINNIECIRLANENLKIVLQFYLFLDSSSNSLCLNTCAIVRSNVSALVVHFTNQHGDLHRYPGPTACPRFTYDQFVVRSEPDEAAIGKRSADQ